MAAEEQVAAYLASLLLDKGYTDAEAREDLGINADKYARYKADAFDRVAKDLLQRPIEHWYLQYAADQARNIAELDKMVERHNKAGTQANALVGAIRLRADLIDRVFARGQDCGVIRPGDKTGDGQSFGTLSKSELVKQLKDEIDGLQSMMSGDDIDFLDLEIGDVHYGEAVIESSEASNTTPDENAPRKKKKNKRKKRTKEKDQKRRKQRF